MAVGVLTPREARRRLTHRRVHRQQANAVVAMQQAAAVVAMRRAAGLDPYNTSRDTHAAGQGARAPSAPRVPTAPTAPKPAAPRAPQAPVLDSEALAAIAQLRNRRDTGVNQLTQAQSYDDVDYKEALRRRAEQQPEQRQSLKENMNRQGLFFSGQYGKAQGDLETQFIRSDTDARTDYDRRKAERAAARQALLSGYTVDEAAAIAESVGRRVERDALRADQGSLARTSSAAPTPAPGSAGGGGSQPQQRAQVGAFGPSSRTGSTGPSGSASRTGRVGNRRPASRRRRHRNRNRRQ